jgi:hypothetical protein
MPDLRIYPTELQVGDWITSDLRRDYYVATVALVDGDVLINEGTRDQVRIDREQTVTIMPRHLAARRTPQNAR